MPKLIVNRKKPSPTPPCGRKITYVLPHTPFQKLIDTSLKAIPSRKFPGRSMSYQEASELIGANSSTVWIWTHSSTITSIRSVTPERLQKLADILKIPLPRLQETYDASRHSYTRKEVPMPAASIDAFEALIRVIENDRRTYLPRSYILNTAKRFLAGAKAQSDARPSKAAPSS